MRIILVVRLVDGDDTVLAWGRVPAIAKGDGALRLEAPLLAAISHEGVPSAVILHWPDVHTWLRIPLPPAHVAALLGGKSTFTPGQPIMLYAAGDIAMSFTQDGPLPCVTEQQSIAISPDPAGVGIGPGKIAVH